MIRDGRFGLLWCWRHPDPSFSSLGHAGSFLPSPGCPPDLRHHVSCNGKNSVLPQVTCREFPSGRQTRPDVTIIEVVAVYPGFGAECDSFPVNDLRAPNTFQPKYLPSRGWKDFTSYFKESLSAWAALNRGTLVAGILILAFV